MSLTSTLPNEVFGVRVYKRLVTNPSLVWANSYEMVSTGSGADLTESGETIAAAFVAGEQLIHGVGVRFDRAVISTWVADGTPYDPDTFISVPVAVGGTRAIAGEPLPLSACLFVRRAVNFGRSGRALYRGALGENEITSPSGTMVVAGVELPFIQAAISDMFLSISTALAGLGLELALKGNSPSDVIRTVNNFTLGGAVSKKLNNRYYDRA